jgi:plasmid maintenance system antidote protein VapI
MLNTARKPVTVGEMLVEEFLGPLSLTREHWLQQWACSENLSTNSATIVAQ